MSKNKEKAWYLLFGDNNFFWKERREMMSEKHYSMGERGSAALYGIVGLLVIYYFSVEAHRHFDVFKNPVMFWLMIIILGLTSFCAMGCAIHMRAVGGKPPRRLRKEARAEVSDLRTLLDNSKAKITELEASMLRHVGGMTRRAVDCIGIAKKIIRALEKRVDEVSHLLETSRSSDIIEAYELLYRPLVVHESCCDALIDSDPIPAIDPNEWAPTLTRLFSVAQAEIQRITEQNRAMLTSIRGDMKEAVEAEEPASSLTAAHAVGAK